MNGIISLPTDVASLAKTLGGLPGSSNNTSQAGFSDIFSDIYEMAESTDQQDKGSALSLLTGEVDDISSVLIDSEKAEIALSLTIQVRNKLLDAYNEIMNMQV